MSISAQNRSLPDWFTRIRTRQTVLPRFQRFEAWSYANVTQLFNTVLQGLPVGAVLVLEVGNQEPFLSRTIVGAPETGERVTEHLLDGQQRLTALWRGLHNNYPDRTFFLYLTDDDETGQPYWVDSIARWKNANDTDYRPFWANNPNEQWARGAIPLDLCAPGEGAVTKFNEWAKKAIADADEREKVKDRIWAIRQVFATFNLPYLSLPATTHKETALDVFLKMNTSAAPLSTYDIVVAQVEAGMGQSLHDLVSEIRKSCPDIEHYYTAEDIALYASALLHDKPPSNATYMENDFGTKLVSTWEKLLKGIGRAATFLQEERIFDAARLPTDVIVPVLAALWANAPDGLDIEGRYRSVLRKYVWRAVFTNRYEKSTTSRSLADYLELKSYLDKSSVAVPVVFDDAQHPLPQIPELLNASWPKKKDRLARAILALALRQGGHDLADGSTVSRANLPKREYHHLFPDAHLRAMNVPDDKIYRSLNCALVTRRTNRNISCKEPERYLAERREAAELGEADLVARLASHLIPYQEMIEGDYDAFLEARASLIHSAMLEICGTAKADADTTPSLQPA